MKELLFKTIFLTTLCILCLPACVASSPIPVPTNLASAATPPAVSTIAVTDQAIATQAMLPATNVLTHTPILASPPPTLSPTPPGVSAPSGLVYTSDHALWMVATDGHPAQIGAMPETSGVPRIHFSPDHAMVLYDDWKECWVADLAGGQATRITESATAYVSCQWALDGKSVYYTDSADLWAVNVRAVEERRNLTQTSDRVEDRLLPLWSARPELLFFYSWPVEVTPDGVGWTGALTSMNAEKTEYHVMVETLSADTPAYSPDGKTFAYTDGSHVWLYNLEMEPQRVDLERYGLEIENPRVTSPSWAPDGTQIAGWITGKRDGSAFSGLLLFNVSNQSAQIVHPVYLPMYWDSHPPAPEWSPDSQWLIYWGEDENGERLGIWAINRDGIQTYALASTDASESTCETPWDPGQRRWSPDGQQLIFTGCAPISEPGSISRGIRLTEPGQWEISRIDLPPDAQIVDWINAVP